MSSPTTQVKACVESLLNKPVDAGIYVEVAEPVDGKYTAQRFEIKVDGTTAPDNVQFVEGATYYAVIPSTQEQSKLKSKMDGGAGGNGNRKNRKSSRKNRKSSRKNRKSSSSRRSRK